ncbi:Conserved_hypothetical protein [Hexamita inflata]|uniref:Uncharacterized protein n=1 Tax=Hexamita inflata TaxID=28002 RepID=A0AA86QU69_9EUKA|nr:Conserved hypothetical protein [Hexamita inflata]
MDPDNNPENLPEIDIAGDAENPFLLPPDHPLFAPLQKKLKDNMTDEIKRARDTIQELMKLKSQLNLRQEQAGVDMHQNQKQLAENQQKLENLSQIHADTAAARMKVTEIQKEVGKEMNQATAELQSAQIREQEIRDQISAVAQQVMQIAQDNAELKSDATIRKRTVYRAEEQIKEEERRKADQEALIEMHQNELRRQQDQEMVLLKQLDIQQQETIQANAILDEAVVQMEQIKGEIAETRKRWQLTLKQIEHKTTILKAEIELKIQEQESTKISLEQGIKSGKLEREKLIAQVAKVTDDTRKLQNKKTSIIDQKEYLKNEVLAELSQRYSGLNQEVREKANKLNQVGAAIAKEQKIIEEISRQNDKAQRTLNDVENSILIKNAEQAANNRQLSGQRIELQKVKDEIKKAQREIEKTQNEIQKRRYDQVSCEGAVSTLLNAQQALEVEIKEKDDLITSYEQQIRKNANAIEQRSSAITRLNKKLEEYQKAHPESDNGPLQATLNNLNKELATAGKQVKDVQAAWLRCQTDLVTFSQQYQQEVEEIRDKEEQKELLERKLKDLDFENQSNKLKIQAIKRDVEFLHKDIQQLNEKMYAMDRQIELLHETNFDSEVGTQQQIDEKITDIDRIKGEIITYSEEKQDLAASLIEVEEQIMLWQRKIQIQYQLMNNIKENCSLASGGEIAQLEQDVHNQECAINQMKKKQKELLMKMEQGIDMRMVHSNTVRALQSVTKTTGAKTGASVQQERDATELRIKQAAQKLEKAKTQYADVNRKFQEGQQENEELQGVIQQLQERMQ